MDESRISIFFIQQNFLAREAGESPTDTKEEKTEEEEEEEEEEEAEETEVRQTRLRPQSSRISAKNGFYL